jgi:hypothetical protein
MSKHLKLRRNWRRARRLSGDSVSRVLRVRRLTLKRSGARPGFRAGDGLQHWLRSDVAAVPGGIDILGVDRRAEQFVAADNC